MKLRAQTEKAFRRILLEIKKKIKKKKHIGELGYGMDQPLNR